MNSTAVVDITKVTLYFHRFSESYYSNIDNYFNPEDRYLLIIIFPRRTFAIAAMKVYSKMFSET